LTPAISISTRLSFSVFEKFHSDQQARFCTERSF
jgi:hypothetical protein